MLKLYSFTEAVLWNQREHFICDCVCLSARCKPSDTETVDTQLFTAGHVEHCEPEAPCDDHIWTKSRAGTFSEMQSSVIIIYSRIDEVLSWNN